MLRDIDCGQIAQELKLALESAVERAVPINPPSGVLLPSKNQPVKVSDFTVLGHTITDQYKSRFESLQHSNVANQVHIQSMYQLVRSNSNTIS